MADSSAKGVAWDLGDLYAGTDDPALKLDLDQAKERARRFEEDYRGRIATATGPDAPTLLAALSVLESIQEQMARPAIFAGLQHAVKMDDLARRALRVMTQQRVVEVNQHLGFFDLEWIQVPDAAAAALCADSRLAHYKHLLDQKRALKPHRLSEPEEKLLEQKNATGRSAFVRLFDEIVSTIEFPFRYGGETKHLPQSKILAYLSDRGRTARQAAAAGLTEGLKGNARLLTYLFNTLRQDHRTDCSMHKFSDPAAPRHLANELSPTVVDTLITACERHYPLAHRYYRLKARLLKHEIFDYDRYAPLSADTTAVDWTTARRVVQESYTTFSSTAGEIVRQFFERRWIDAAPTPGKHGGAFSASTIPSVHPYILMNYTDKVRDVMTLAHELGHGIHQYLSRGVGYLQCDTPLTTAESASVFGELLTFRRFLELCPDTATRLSLLCGMIEDAFATVFRQVVLTRFEQGLYRAGEVEGDLRTEQINSIWLDANRLMHGDAVHLTDDYGWWWMYIGHFIRSPFYCYAYAFGRLLALSLFQRYQEEGEAFVPRYLEMLSKGGSEAPEVLVGRLGMDVTDPGFWELGLRLLGDMVTEAEQLGSR